MGAIYFSVPVTVDLHSIRGWHRENERFFTIRYHFHGIDEATDNNKLYCGDILRSASNPKGAKQQVKESIELSFTETNFEETLSSYLEGNASLEKVTANLGGSLGFEKLASAKLEIGDQLEKRMEFEETGKHTLTRTYSERMTKTVEGTISFDDSSSGKHVAVQKYLKRKIDVYLTHVDWLTVSYEPEGVWGSRSKKNLPNAGAVTRRNGQPNLKKLSRFVPVCRFGYWKPISSYDWLPESEYKLEVALPDSIEVEDLDVPRSFATPKLTCQSLYTIANNVFPRRYKDLEAA